MVVNFFELRKFEMMNPKRLDQAPADSVSPTHQNRFHTRGDFMIQNKIGDEFKVKTCPVLFFRQEENFKLSFPKVRNRFRIRHPPLKTSTAYLLFVQQSPNSSEMVSEHRKQYKLPYGRRFNNIHHGTVSGAAALRRVKHQFFTI
jgi:hypothetical protein